MCSVFRKTLILIPNPALSGGVSNYYKVAEKYFSSNVNYVNFNSKYNKGLFKVIFNVFTIIKVLVLIAVCFPKRIVVNPSLAKIAFLRDGLFVFWSHLFLKKTIIFWRGWNPENEGIFNNRFLNALYKLSYLKSSKHLVLNRYIKTRLMEMGVKKENIYFTNTIVDDSFINHNVEAQKTNMFTILFLTRIERYKGIYETLEIYEKLKSQNLDIELHIAGDGNELDRIKEVVVQKRYSNIKFLGFIEGEEKIKAFKNADVYLFPSYSEGMPNSVIEAMGCGLPVVCTNVGALSDFFEDGKMGYMHPLPISIDAFESSILNIYSNKELQSAMSRFNYRYAKETFIASKSIQTLEGLIINQ